jgi:hypothetical protein
MLPRTDLYSVVARIHHAKKIYPTDPFSLRPHSHGDSWFSRDVIVGGRHIVSIDIRGCISEA